MLDPATCVKDLLVTAAVGEFAAADPTKWSIEVGHFNERPTAPEKQILVNHTGGLPPYPKIALDQPSITITVRGAKNGYPAAKTKAMAVKDALLGMNTTIVGTTISPAYAGDTYQNCVMLGDIIYLGQDEAVRPLFSLNFRFIVLPVPSGNRVAIV